MVTKERRKYPEENTVFGEVYKSQALQTFSTISQHEPIKGSLYLHLFLESTLSRADLFLEWLLSAKGIIFLLTKPRTVKKIANSAFLSRLWGLHSQHSPAFLFAGFPLSPPSQEVFWIDWLNSLPHFRYRKMRYFHSTRHRTYQNFRPMSHLISPRCPQPNRVHVGKTIDWLVELREAFY